MSDIDSRLKIGRVVIPQAAGGKPYERKAGNSTIYTYLFFTGALNGPDKGLDLTFWDEVPEKAKALLESGNLVAVHGKWNDGRYTDRDGEEQFKPSITVWQVWDLGSGVLPQRERKGAPIKAVPKRRREVVHASLDDDFDPDGF